MSKPLRFPAAAVCVAILSFEDFSQADELENGGHGPGWVQRTTGGYPST